jgi:hypothetical protein
MTNYINGVIIVEGKTEYEFAKQLLYPYLANKNIFITPTQASKPGQKGGDIRFHRVKKDIKIHLQNPKNNFVTTMIDYYGTKDWPGLKQITKQHTPQQITSILSTATNKELLQDIPEYELKVKQRFIFYMSMHEFEALLFSNPQILADKLKINIKKTTKIVRQYKTPEAINNHPNTAPSKILARLSKGNFSKIVVGIDIAKAIGIEAMREQCPLFNAWLQKLEYTSNKF